MFECGAWARGMKAGFPNEVKLLQAEGVVHEKAVFPTSEQEIVTPH